jgi:hypothetical protein
MTVEQLLENCSQSELSEWRAYDLIEPIGGQRLDMNIAHLICYIGSIMGVHKDKNIYISDMALNWEDSLLSEEERKERQAETQRRRLHDKLKNVNTEKVAEDVKRAFQKVGKNGKRR